MDLSKKFKAGHILTIIILFCILGYALQRDLWLKSQNTGDLRNRIVGARLQKDGKDPYFYKWKEGESLRYFDPQNQGSQGVSNISSSPAFHDMLHPVCDLSQQTISNIWLVVQYLMLGLIGILFFRLCETDIQKYCVASLLGAFLLTEAWKHHVYKGQLYIIIAGLLALAGYCLLRKQKSYHFLLAGLSTAAAILIKPSALLFILPFFLYYKVFPRYILTTFSFLLIYGLFAAVNEKERGHWLSYSKAIKEQVAFHQAENQLADVHLPEINELEGFAFGDRHRSEKNDLNQIRTENGNAFVLYKKLFGKAIPLPYLSALSLLAIALVLGGLLLPGIRNSQTIPQLIIAGLLLYNLVDIFGPITRHQYYTVQWFPLVMLGFLTRQSWKDPATILLLAGLILNILRTDIIDAPHTIGEFCWIIASLLIIFKRNTSNSTGWNMQLS